MKRSDLKYLKLIPVKGWSKNKPTCENAVSQTLYGSSTLRVMGSCYIGMCGPKEYGFSAVLVINRVSILADFGHFGHK